MKETTRLFRSTAARAVLALVLGTAGSAQAVLLELDPASSSVTYDFGGIVLCDASGDCPEPPPSQTFSLSGSFELERGTFFVPVSIFPPDGYFRDEIRFRSVSIESGGAASLGFTFPDYFAVVEGGSFRGSEDPCAGFPPVGLCWAGQFGWYSGEFDGRTLTMTGVDYAGTDFLADRFDFTVIARAADVANIPEPGTLACAAVALVGLAAGRRRLV